MIRVKQYTAVWDNRSHNGCCRRTVVYILWIIPVFVYERFP